MKKYILLSLLIFGTIFTKKIDAQNLNTIIEIYLDNNFDLFKQEPFNRSTFDVTFQKDAVIHNDIVKDYLKVTHPNNKDIVTTIHLNKRKHEYEEFGYVYQLQVRQIIDGIKENDNQVNYYSDIAKFYLDNIVNIHLENSIYSNFDFSEKLRISFYERLINLIDNANSLLKDITEQDIEKCSETISTGSYNNDLCTNYFTNKQYIEFDLDGFEDWMSSDNSKEFFEKYVGYILNYSGSMLIENDYEFSTNDAVPGAPAILNTIRNNDDAILFQIHKSFIETDYKDELPDISILKFLFEEINNSTPSNRASFYLNPFDSFRGVVEMLILEIYQNYFLGLPHYLTGLSTPSGTNLTDPVNIFIKFPSLSFKIHWLETVFNEYREAGILDKTHTLQDFKNELKNPEGRKLHYRAGVKSGLIPTDVTYEKFDDFYFFNNESMIEFNKYSLPSVWIQIEKKYDGDSGNITIDKTISFDELDAQFLKNYINDPKKIVSERLFSKQNQNIILVKENGSLFAAVDISESIKKLFLVDTGASISMISHEDYVFLNYTNQVKELGQVEVQLASGTAFLKKVEISSLNVGGHEISNIEVIVGDSRLLGTDLLDRLGNWRINNEKIVIE